MEWGAGKGKFAPHSRPNILMVDKGVRDIRMGLSYSLKGHYCSIFSRKPSEGQASTHQARTARRSERTAGPWLTEEDEGQLSQMCAMVKLLVVVSKMCRAIYWFMTTAAMIVGCS